jgi:ligand-binding sensor domain-containing protein
MRRAATWGLLGVAAWIGSQPTWGRAGPIEVGPAEIDSPLTLELPYSDVEGGVMAPTGEVWVAAKYALLRLAPRPGAPPERIGVDLPQQTWSAIATTASGRLLVGTYQGTVIEGADGRWSPLGGDAALGGRVRTFAEANGRLYAGIESPSGDGAAASGLKAWNVGDAHWEPVPLEAGRVLALATAADGTLLVGGSQGLWRCDHRSCHPTWRSEAAVRAIAPQPGGGLWLGTENGLVELGADGRELRRELAGDTITAIAAGPAGEIWVGTWNRGLLHSGAPGAWASLGFRQGLAADEVTFLVLDARSVLWVGLYSAGVARAPAATLAPWMAANASRAAARLPDVGVFADACAATESLLGRPGASGEVALEHADGRTLAFLKGELVCPRLPGYRREDGTWAFIEDECLRRRDDGDCVPLPAALRAGSGSKLFLDRLGRLWLSAGGGLHILEESGTWAHRGGVALEDTGITALREDAEGAIWVGTYPPYDPVAGAFRQPSLIRLESDSTTAYGVADGLPAAGVQVIEPLADGDVLVGTNGGLARAGRAGVRPVGAFQPHFVNDLTRDARGRLLIAHLFWGEGLTVLDGGETRRWTSREGLFADRLAAVALDGEGRAWLVDDEGRVGVYAGSLLWGSSAAAPAGTLATAPSPEN